MVHHYAVELTQALLKQRLRYDPETGVFTYTESRVGRVAGKPAGNVWSKKDRPDLQYLYIGVGGKRYQAHRLAFLYMTGRWPEAKVDHRDHNGLNNRWDNLRDASQRQNMQHTRLRSNNTSGYKGVAWDSNRKKWQVHISINGKNTSLGRFDIKEEAIEVYRKAAERHFGEFALTGTAKAHERRFAV